MKKSITMFSTLAAIACITSMNSIGGAAPSSVPVFHEESIGSFNAALQHNHQRTVDAVHQSRSNYRAFKFLDPQMVIVGVASAVTVDSSGRVHIVQAHGQPMGGHPNATHEEYSHILLPAASQPPGR